MADGATLGKAYVQIIPSMDGTSARIEELLGSEGEQAGKSAGEKAGSGLLSSLNEIVSKGHLDSVSQLVQNTGQKIGDFGKSMSKNVTAPLTAFGTAAVAAFKKYDDGADTIIQKTGASGEALASMEGLMKNITSSIPIGFDKAGAAIGEVNTRFGSTGDELESLSKQFLEFAELNGTEVSGSIDTVQKAMSAFGLGTEYTGAMLDTLNVVGQNTGINVDLLAQSMTSNAQSLKQMGLNAADAANLIGNLEKSGIDTSTVMVGMKKVLSEAMTSGVSGQEAFQKALSSNENAIAIFGERAGPVLKSAFDDGTLSMDMFVGGSTDLMDNLGSVAETYENTLDPIDKLQTTLNASMPVLAEIGNSIMVSLQPALDLLCVWLEKATNWWESLDGKTQTFITTAILVIAAAGPIIGIIGSVVSGIGSLISMIGLLMNPIGLCVVAIGTVFAALVALYNKNEDFRKFIHTCWNAISSTISGIVTGVVDTVTNAWISIQQKVQSISDYTSSVWDSIKTTTANVWDGIKWAIENPLEAAKAVVKGIIDTIKGFFNFSISWPHIPMPHFSINPLGWHIGDLLKGSIPSLGINWYAKAMDQPRILDGAQFFGFMNGKMLGGGESGKEVVYGHQQLMNDIKEAVKSEKESKFDGRPIVFNIYAAKGQDEKKIAKEVADILKKELDRRDF